MEKEARTRRTKNDEVGPEIVVCRAVTCRSWKRGNKCEIVHPFGMRDDKISHNAQGLCENFFTE